MTIKDVNGANHGKDGRFVADPLDPPTRADLTPADPEPLFDADYTDGWNDYLAHDYTPTAVENFIYEVDTDLAARLPDADPTAMMKTIARHAAKIADHARTSAGLRRMENDDEGYSGSERRECADMARQSEELLAEAWASLNRELHDLNRR